MTIANNHRLELGREVKQKREEMIERQKIEIIAIKCYRNKKGISLCSEKEEDYGNDTKGNTNLDQTKDEYLPQQ